jgi:DNA-binding CsgD family transcriptional regulator
MINSPLDARACANALARIATDTGQPEALSALAHALGEIALLEGNSVQAVLQFNQGLELLNGIEIPYCHALTEFRAGVACAAASDKPAAIEHLSNAYRTARKFGAPPLATMIANALASLGEPVSQRLGERAGTRFHHHDLTRRQLEILRLVAQGQTTPEIARQLFLSPRTVEMHVGNILAAFDSHSRTEAVRKATELGLLTP